MSLAAAAVSYAERGWAVFPLGRRSKAPAISRDAGGRGLHDATTDPDRVARWWQRHPDHNIGLRTGVAFDALDVDPRHGGLEALTDLCAGRASVDGPTVVTGTGGWHVYVRTTSGGNRAGFVPGCDWKSANGYVVAPPSVHPDTGQRYRWHEDFGPDTPIVPAPAWLLDALRPGPAEVVAVGQKHVPNTGNRSDAYGRRALEGEVGRVALAPVGQRNSQLNCSAYNLGQLVAAGQLDLPTVVDALLLAATRAGLGATEAERTIVSGLNAGTATPRSVPA